MSLVEEFLSKKKAEVGVALNDVQREAVLHTEGPLLLLASPGSGKTTTIIMRIGYLIEEKGIAPSRIKAVTFSNASANDMKERFKRFFPTLPSVDFSTIHSLAFRVVREHLSREGIEYELIEGDSPSPYNKKRMLRQLFKNINNDVITEDQLDDLTTYISFIKNKLIPEDKWSMIKSDVPNALEIIKQYEQFKQTGTRRLLVDYDDMLTIANNAFENNSLCLERYQSKYDYVLTDESQDTSLVQHKIIEKLVQRHQNLCVVADDDQSIYGWRAAEPQYLLDFKQVHPSAKILKMEQNYRSSQQIVATANQFIKQNKNRYDKNMFTENQAQKPIVLNVMSENREQCEYLVTKISEVKDLREIAILYRNNSSSVLLMDAFDRAKIPFYIKDSDLRFFSHWIVQDILNFMRLAFDVTRVDIFERIFSKFNLYLNKAHIEQLRYIQNNQSIFDNLMGMSSLQDWQIRKIRDYKDAYNQLTLEKPIEVMRTIRDDFGYEKVLKKMSEELGFKMDGLLDILNTLEEISKSTHNMIDFANRIKYLEKLTKSSKFNKNKNAVTFSTLHSSKGLEFSKVFMIDLINGIIPSKSESNLKPSELEEEVRLFYVGMTRAKVDLELISYNKKFGKLVKPSPFLDDVKKILHPHEKNEPLQQVKNSSVTIRKKNLRPKVPINPNAIKDKDELEVGALVKHRVFGKGEIVNFDDDLLEIRFQKGIKNLSVDTCLEMGLIEFD